MYFIRQRNDTAFFVTYSSAVTSRQSECGLKVRATFCQSELLLQLQQIEIIKKTQTTQLVLTADTPRT
jgi:hypothetical protein